MLYFLQGLTMGLAYVAPIGLQNLFIINTALSASRPRALGTAAIVIFFDITLALACFFGIGAIMQRYTWLQMLILLVGSLIVLHIGISLLRTQATDLHQTQQPQSWRAVISTACVVTWFNPQASIDGTMMLGAFHVTLPASQSSAFIAGVALASCLWFSCLTLLVAKFRSHFSAHLLQIINFVCGLIIVFYGCKLLWNFFTLLLQ